MTDAQLAQAHHDAIATNDEEALIDTEGNICDRLNIPLDETEQGLTPNAVALIDAFVASH